jgi:hypothetical protein
MSLPMDQVIELLKLAGLAAAGLWAAYTFHKLQRVRAAELENNHKLAAIRTSRMEADEREARLLGQQPQLAIQLNVTEKVLPGKRGGSFLCATAILKNEGSQSLQRPSTTPF